ncbi:hypothetical protein B5807_08125 [Epicoccum nigrum]|uniref:Uncharacterized protein n=1 Tax=Epicoccum nigrum TaxID=105696 RepID=A0A1Y2LR29_EPING|nr:hypothetical protein B5807_08125 [Epicoccum nigrum]
MRGCLWVVWKLPHCILVIDGSIDVSWCLRILLGHLSHQDIIVRRHGNRRLNVCWSFWVVWHLCDGVLVRDGSLNVGRRLWVLRKLKHSSLVRQGLSCVCRCGRNGRVLCEGLLDWLRCRCSLLNNGHIDICAFLYDNLCSFRGSSFLCRLACRCLEGRGGRKFSIASRPRGSARRRKNRRSIERRCCFAGTRCWFDGLGSNSVLDDWGFFSLCFPDRRFACARRWLGGLFCYRLFDGYGFARACRCPWNFFLFSNRLFNDDGRSCLGRCLLDRRFARTRRDLYFDRGLWHRFLFLLLLSCLFGDRLFDDRSRGFATARGPLGCRLLDFGCLDLGCASCACLLLRRRLLDRSLDLRCSFYLGLASCCGCCCCLCASCRSRCGFCDFFFDDSLLPATLGRRRQGGCGRRYLWGGLGSATCGDHFISLVMQ